MSNQTYKQQDFRASSIAVRNRDELFAERLDILFSGQVTATVGTLLSVLVLVLLQFDHSDPVILLAWLGYMAFISLCRVVMVGIYSGRSQGRRNPLVWYRLYVVGTLLQSLGWGATMIGVFPLELDIHQLATAFILGGLCAAALTTMSADPISYFIFIIPILFPMVIHFSMQGDSQDIAIATILACYFLFLTAAVRRSHTLLMKTLTLRFINAELLDRVTQEKEEVLALNTELQQEIRTRRTAERKARSLEMTDQLTGLANRKQFEARLTEACDEASRSNGIVGLMLLDLDGFKAINKEFGHKIGDEILQELSVKIGKECRFIDMLARTGGDEFAIILDFLDEASLEKTPALRITHMLKDPLSTSAGPIRLTMSIGVSFYPADGDTADSLFSAADMSLQAAMDRGGEQVMTYHNMLR